MSFDPAGFSPQEILAMDAVNDDSNGHLVKGLFECPGKRWQWLIRILVIVWYLFVLQRCAGRFISTRSRNWCFCGRWWIVWGLSCEWLLPGGLSLLEDDVDVCWDVGSLSLLRCLSLSERSSYFRDNRAWRVEAVPEFSACSRRINSRLAKVRLSFFSERRASWCLSCPLSCILHFSALVRVLGVQECILWYAGLKAFEYC